MWFLFVIIILIAVVGIVINRAIIKEKERQNDADAHEIAEQARSRSSQTKSDSFSVNAKSQTASPNRPDKPAVQKPEGIIDDPTYIKEIKHISGIWHEYDILLAAQIYGWDTIIDWAAYVTEADLKNISEVTTASMIGSSASQKITDEYKKADGDLNKIEMLKNEWGVFSIAGMSEALHAPLKIVWMNQTKLLRLFTLIDDEDLINRYTETLIRRSFNTADAMKRAKPLT